MINRTILQGRLVSDPVMKYTPSNVAMAQVSVAWSDKYKEFGEAVLSALQGMGTHS